MKALTFGIVTFMRPEKLRRLVESIRDDYPSAVIVIADNGRKLPESPHRLSACLQGCKTWVLPFDCGLSESRNFLIANTTGDLLILDDDFEFTEKTNIEAMQAVLEHDSSVGIVCGDAGFTRPMDLQGDGSTSSAGSPIQFSDPGRQIKSTADMSSCKRATPLYQYCDLADNFMLIRRKCLDDGIRWNPGLKVGEHWDFFQRLKQQGKWKVAFVPSVKIKHEKLHDDPPEYQACRQRASEFNRMMRKPQLPPSIVVLGVGHSGTRIFVRTLEALGWNLGDVDDGVAEHREVKRINKQILQRQGICPCGGELTLGVCGRCREHATNMLPHPAPHEFHLALKSIPQPWCIKDPRMVLTFDHWKPAFSKHRPLLLLVERDLDRMRKTYERYNFPDFCIYGRDVPELVEMARWHFKCWEGPKLELKYEQLADAVRLFDLKRAT